MSRLSQLCRWCCFEIYIYQLMPNMVINWFYFSIHLAVIIISTIPHVYPFYDCGWCTELWPALWLCQGQVLGPAGFLQLLIPPTPRHTYTSDNLPGRPQPLVTICCWQCLTINTPPKTLIILSSSITRAMGPRFKMAAIMGVREVSGFGDVDSPSSSRL